MMTLPRRAWRSLNFRLRRLLFGPPPAPPPPPPPDPARLPYVRRERFLICDALADALPADERFIILEGGAGHFTDPRWQAFDPPRKRLYGFEPDTAQCAAFNDEARQRGLDYRFYPIGLWSAPARLPLYENESPGGHSFYPQNTGLTDRWKFQSATVTRLAKDTFFPRGTSDWDLTSLDRWAAEQSVDAVDFMKLNVQGAELEILKGARTLLERTTGVQVEVAFVESYTGRPMFADIDAFLRAEGFTFFELIGHHYIGRATAPITVQQMPGLYPLHGQLIEGHGVYFRDPIELARQGRLSPRLDAGALLKLAGFAELYGQQEFAFELLYWIAERFARPDVAALADRLVATYRDYFGPR